VVRCKAEHCSSNVHSSDKEECAAREKHNEGKLLQLHPEHVEVHAIERDDRPDWGCEGEDQQLLLHCSTMMAQ
jgi:hypothetical protein